MSCKPSKHDRFINGYRLNKELTDIPGIGPKNEKKLRKAKCEKA